MWLGWTLWRALRLDELCERLLPRGREEVEPGSSGEVQVGDEGVEELLLDELLSPRELGDRHHVEPFPLQKEREARPNRRVVFDHEHPNP